MQSTYVHCKYREQLNEGPPMQAQMPELSSGKEINFFWENKKIPHTCTKCKSSGDGEQN